MLMVFTFYLFLPHHRTDGRRQCRTQWKGKREGWKQQRKKNEDDKQGTERWRKKVTLVLHGELRRINGARDRLYVYASEIMLHVVGRVHKTARMWPPVHRESKKERKNARMLRSRCEWFPQANPVRGPCRAFRLIHVVAFGSEVRSVELASLFLWAFVCMCWVLCVCVLEEFAAPHIF